MKSILTPSIKPEPQETRLEPLAESSLRRNASDASDTLTKVKPEPKDSTRVVGFPSRDALRRFSAYNNCHLKFADRGLPVPPYAADTVPSGSGAGNASSSYATARAGAAPKSEDFAISDMVNHAQALEEPKPRLYTIYESATDIPYQPEDALKEGISMVKALKANIKKLELGSKLRQDVWLREIERYLVSLDIEQFVHSSVQPSDARGSNHNDRSLRR